MSRRRLLIALAALSAVGLVAAVFVISRRPAAPIITRAPVATLGQFTTPAPSAQPAKGLRSEIVQGLGLGVTVPWDHRIRLIRALPADLTAAEAEALLTALMARCPRTFDPGTHATYMHEIACKLQARADTRERFARALATLARDTQRDTSTRDYAIQHLRQVWSHAAADPALRALVTATFRELTGLDPAVATSSLLSLHLLGSAAELRIADGSREILGQPGTAFRTAGTPEPASLIPDSELAPLLEPIFATGNSRANLSARLTAVRVIGERRLQAYRQPLLKMVADRSEHALLRMAAAGALGNIGDPADLKVLSSLDPGDARVAVAVRQALRPGVGR